MYTQHSKVRAHCFFFSSCMSFSFSREPKVPIRLYSKQDSLSILGSFKIWSRRTTVLPWWNYSHMVFLNIRDHRFLHERDSLAQIPWHYLSKINVAHRRSDSQPLAWLRFHLYQSWTRLVSKKKKKKGKRCALFTNMVNLQPVCVFRVEPGLLRIIGSSQHVTQVTVCPICAFQKKKKKGCMCWEELLMGGMNAHDEEL